MTVYNQDDSMHQGTTRVLEVTVRQDDGQVKDLTGCTLTWKMSKSANRPAVLTKSLGSGIQYIDEDAGLLNITLIPADTTNLLGDYYHELSLTDSSNRQSVVLTGTITIKKRLTL